MPGKTRRRGLASEFWLFLRENKKWWMTPIVMLFALLAAVVVLGATGALPLMYTLF